MTKQSGRLINLSILRGRRFWFTFKMLQYRTYRNVVVHFCLFLLGAFTTLLITSLARDECQDTYDLCDLGISLPRTDNVLEQKRPSLSAAPSSRKYVREEILFPPVGVDLPLPSNANAGNVYSIGELVQKNPSQKLLGQRLETEEGKIPSAWPTGTAASSQVKGHGDWSSYRYQLDPHGGNVELTPYVYVDPNLIYVVTPTYNRPEQIPELTRVAQALQHVKNFVHWVVVEDVDKRTDGLGKFLKKFKIDFDLLTSVKPECSDKVVGKPRGVGARRAAIEWLRKNNAQGILYFADDDNTYDSDIFRQMTKTKKVSMWPVGLVTDLGVSSPVVRDGQVVGFYDGWKADRRFPVDMAGFAINLRLLHMRKKANMPWVVGYEEDGLLKSLGITFKDIQPLAKNCTEILVWHTKAIKNKWARTPTGLKPGMQETTNLHVLLQKLPHPDVDNPNPKGLRSDCESKEFSLMKYIFGN